VVSTVLWHQSEFLQFPQAQVPAQYCKIIHQDQRVAHEIFQADCDTGVPIQRSRKVLAVHKFKFQTGRTECTCVHRPWMVILLLKLVWRGWNICVLLYPRSFLGLSTYLYSKSEVPPVSFLRAIELWYCPVVNVL
jgi:hypothetical protein